MTFNQFDQLTQDIISKVLKMRDTKGKEYAGKDTDRLKNFKDIAEEVGLDPIQIWHVYYKKHIRAIDSYVKTGQVFSEPIEGRFVDAITYLLLGYGLIVEATSRKPDNEDDVCICHHSKVQHESQSGICLVKDCDCSRFDAGYTQRDAKAEYTPQGPIFYCVCPSNMINPNCPIHGVK